MPKATRSLRLSDRTWSQLEKLAPWLQVDDRTKVVEILAEREAAKMPTQNEQALQAYRIGQVIRVELEEGGTEQASIVNFTAEGYGTDQGRLDGVAVRLANGSLMSIPAKYLELDGSGM